MHEEVRGHPLQVLRYRTISQDGDCMAIKLTNSAAERIRSFLEKDGGVGLRLGVKRTGCSGWAYVVQLANGIEPSDVVFEDKGIKIVVQNASLEFLDGSEIDFASEGLGRSFQFNNPNATEACGCGESFTVG